MKNFYLFLLSTSLMNVSLYAAKEHEQKVLKIISDENNKPVIVSADGEEVELTASFILKLRDFLTKDDMSNENEGKTPEQRRSRTSSFSKSFIYDRFMHIL